MTEFWKVIPPNEPYRVLLGEVRNRLYQTRERSRHLLAHGYSDIPEEETFTNVEEVQIPWLIFYLLQLLQTINVMQLFPPFVKISKTSIVVNTV